MTGIPAMTEMTRNNRDDWNDGDDEGYYFVMTGITEMTRDDWDE